jgi:hypothetical protein
VPERQPPTLGGQLNVFRVYRMSCYLALRIHVPPCRQIARRRTYRYPESLEWHDRAIKGMQARADDDKQARDWLWKTHVDRANALAQLRRHQEAALDWGRAAELAGADYTPALRVGLALSLTRAGDYSRAAEEAKSADADSKRLDGPRLYDLACVHSLLAGAAQGDLSLSAGEREKRSERHAHLALAFLNQSSAKGYFQGQDELRHLLDDPDLEPLRHGRWRASFLIVANMIKGSAKPRR